MTEAEWLYATVPTPMLEFLRGKASDRKLRLFAVSCCCSLERVLCDEAFYLLDISERFADGQADADQLADARRLAKTPQMANTPDVLHLRDQGSQHALRAAVLTAWGKTDSIRATQEVVYAALQSRRQIGFKKAPAEFAAVLRCIFNPFHPVSLNPAWQTSTVLALAQGIYHDRAFDRLPILADALQDASCDNPDLLNHCRSEGPHTRGCWAIDLLLTGYTRFVGGFTCDQS